MRDQDQGLRTHEKVRFVRVGSAGCRSCMSCKSCPPSLHLQEGSLRETFVCVYNFNEVGRYIMVKSSFDE